MNKAIRYGKILLFLALAVMLVSVCAVALADVHTGDHVWDSGEKILDANCDHPARYRFTCTICGATKEENVGESDMSKHDWGAWVIDKAPSCTEAGERHRVCKNNVHHTETDNPDPLGHDPEWITVTEATCTMTGFRRQVCKRCGLEIATEVIPMKPHTPGNWETKTPAGCETKGEQVRKCTVCETILETKELAPLGHEWTAWTTDEAPTCTKAGTQKRTCNRCGKVETRAGDPALGHNWGPWTEVTAPTCTKPGTEKRVCKRCSIEETREKPATGHKFGPWVVVKAPTCTQPGEEKRTCPACGLEEKRTVPATGHQWDNGKIIKQPTLTEEGLIEYTCTICGEVRQEKIPRKTMANNTICAFGPRLRDVSLYPYNTNQWYMFTPFDASQDGRQTYDLVATNRYIVGTLTIDIRNGEMTIDYQLSSNTVDITLEFFTVLNKIGDIHEYEPENLLPLRMSVRRPINLQETFGDDRNLVLYFCSRANYTYSNRFKPLDYNSFAHQQLVKKMLEIMD